jgi:hypothetical protein
MDRTVPTSGNEEINLYLQTYYSLLRSTREVQIKSLIEAHKHMNSALHVKANAHEPDLAAWIYSILRLPDPVSKGAPGPDGAIGGGICPARLPWR